MQVSEPVSYTHLDVYKRQPVPVLFGDTLLVVIGQRVLDRGLKLACKVPRKYASRLLRRGLGVRSLDDTVRRLARRFYVRSERVTPVSYTHLSVNSNLNKR